MNDEELILAGVKDLVFTRRVLRNLGGMSMIEPLTVLFPVLGSDGSIRDIPIPIAVIEVIAKAGAHA